MDFQIQTVNGVGTMVFAKNTNILTNLWLSLNIDKGSFFANPNFGNELYKIKKVTDANVLLAKQYIEKACQWLLDIGRATKITVTVEKDSEPRFYDRINIKVSATQPDGLIITYDLFKRLV